MCSAGARTFGNQARQPLILESGLGLVEGHAGESEGRRSLGDRPPLGLHATKHLVLHLDQIVGIEELALDEQRVGDDVHREPRCGFSGVVLDARAGDRHVRDLS